MNTKNKLLILLGFSFSFFALCEPPNGAQPIKKNLIPKMHNGTVSFSVNVTNRQDAHTDNRINLSTQQNTQQSTPSNDSQIMNKISELWQENIKIQKQLKEQGSHFLSANKWYLLGSGLLFSYVLLAYLIMSGNSYMGDASLWSSWHQELPLDQLLAIPQEQLTQELIREIQRRYTDSTSISDIVKPLGIFMVKIDQEEEQIKWYQTVYSWLLYIRLTKLVPVGQQRFAKIAERLQRIAYYKNLFKSWTADYQLQQSERFWYRCPEIEYPGLTPMIQLLQIEMRLKALNYWIIEVENRVPAFC
jgi:hypothetical protein